MATSGRWEADEFLPWLWTCHRCGDRLMVAPPHGEADGWATLRLNAVAHLRREHHSFQAEREFDRSEWTQGGEPGLPVDPNWQPLEPSDMGEPEPWDLDEAVRLLKSGMTYNDVAARYGLNPNTLAWRTQGMVPKRATGPKVAAVPAKVKRRAKRMLRQGASMTSVQEKCGISWRQVKRLATEMHLKIRRGRTPRVAQQRVLVFS